MPEPAECLVAIVASGRTRFPEVAERVVKLHEGAGLRELPTTNGPGTPEAGFATVRTLSHHPASDGTRSGTSGRRQTPGDQPVGDSVPQHRFPPTPLP